MKRMSVAMLVVVLFLALGSAVNIGIAWWCGAAGGRETIASDRAVALRIAEVRRWIDRSPGGRILQYAPSRIESSIGATRTVIEAEPPFLPQRWHRMTLVEAGWPLPALAGERWSAIKTDHENAGQRAAMQNVMLVDALNANRLGIGSHNGGHDEDDGILPLRPLWPGMATNTLFYAMALWIALVALPRTLRTLVRLGRGRCPACARPLNRNQRSSCDSCGWIRGVSNWRELAGSKTVKSSARSGAVTP